MSKKQKNRLWKPGDGIRQLLLAWLLATAVEYLLLPGALRDLSGLEGVKNIPALRVAVVTCGLAVVLHLLSRRWDTAALERWTMAAAFGVLTVTLALSGGSWLLVGACVGILAILAAFAFFGWDGSPEPAPATGRNQKACIGITAGMTAVFLLLVCGWTLGRLYTFTVWTYDFGLFAQMFHSMETTGLPMTTLERDGLLSHFAVHVSPIYYLMLPFYMLVPHPATLQVLQGVVMASAVIPLWKIGKARGLTDWQRVLLCALLLAVTAFLVGGSFNPFLYFRF